MEFPGFSKESVNSFCLRLAAMVSASFDIERTLYVSLFHWLVGQ
jgi:hypothetical protein